MKIYKHLLTSFIILSFFSSTVATLAQNSYNLHQLGDETFRFVKLPINWDKDDWTKFGLLAASTFIVTRIDQPVRNEVMKDRSYFHSVPVEAGRMWGEIYTTAITGGAFGIYGLLNNDKVSKRIGFEIYQTAFYAGAVTNILKSIIGRARPFTDKGPNFYNPFIWTDDDYHSLPSGHSTLAFALSTVLSQNVKPGYLKILVYLPAVLTAASRVYQDKHWTSDVFLGAAIGYFVGSWVHSQHNETDESVSIIPDDLITVRISLQ